MATWVWIGLRIMNKKMKEKGGENRGQEVSLSKNNTQNKITRIITIIHKDI